MGTAWFIDGAYALNCWRQVGKNHRLDYTAFGAFIERDASEVIGDAYYFDAPDPNDEGGQEKFFDAIQMPPPDGPGLRVKLGSMQTKDLYWPISHGGGPVMLPNSEIQYKIKIQKQVDVLLAFYLTMSHAAKRWTKLYLVAGDKDFLPVVQYLAEFGGVDVTMFGLRENSSGKPTIANQYGLYATSIFFDDIAAEIAGGTRA